MNTTKIPKISTKQYQCLVCKNIEQHSTNHFGEIYCSCKKCGNRSLQCIEPQAVKARASNPAIATKLHKYRFNIENAEEKKQWEELKRTLKNKGLKLFNAISGVSHKYFDLLPEIATIDTSYVFDNQWNTDAGRLFDWYMEIYPNNKIKQGYWLELTEGHAKAREPKTYNCITTYMGKTIGTDTIKAINEGEASNQLFNKYFREGMDIWSYSTKITPVK